MKRSLLWSMLSKYFHSPELPCGVQIQTHCRGSPALDSSPPATCQSLSTSLPFINHSAPLYHSSIIQHLSAIYHPCFFPSSFLKPLAKGCKYSWPILTGTWSLGIPVLYQHWTSKHPTATEASGKRLCAFRDQPTALCALPAKFFRAYDKPTVVSSHFWMMHSHKTRLLQPASSTEQNQIPL